MYHTKRDCVNNLRPNLRQQARGEGDENLTVADVEIEGRGVEDFNLTSAEIPIPIPSKL